jgi:hypothetical protein
MKALLRISGNKSELSGDKIDNRIKGQVPRIGRLGHYVQAKPGMFSSASCQIRFDMLPIVFKRGVLLHPGLGILVSDH